MKITNIRLGFANNSSSTHSIIITKDHKNIRQNGGSDFGWNFFTLKSKEMKKRYINQTVANSLSGLNIHNKYVNHLSKFLTGFDNDDDCYIDHQSILTLPRETKTTWSGESYCLNEQFLDDFKKFIMRDDIIVLGGNDNTEEEHPHKDKGTLFSYPIKEMNSKDFIARKDGDFWTLFHIKNGDRFTFSFDKEMNPTRPTSPFLIDMKITDYCEMGCKYCYQSSTKKGQHAEFDTIKNILSEINQNNILPFEIAIGGGEPTQHPEFLDILERIKEMDIVPNFTTRNLKYIEENYEKIFKFAGSFAFSIDDNNVSILEQFKPVLDKINGLEAHKQSNSHHVSLQVALGTISEETFLKCKQFVYENHCRLTVLGWKNHGRSLKMKPRDYSWITKYAHEIWDIAVDTAFIQEFSSYVSSFSSNLLWQIAEGYNSCYIDAVKSKMYKSSYHTEIEINIPEEDFYFSDGWERVK